MTGWFSSNGMLKSTQRHPEQDNMIPLTISTKGRGNYGARWYPRPDRISIFVNVIAQGVDPDHPFFEAVIGALYTHEYVHIKHYRSGCKSGVDCRDGKCFWCNQTHSIMEYL